MTDLPDGCGGAADPGDGEERDVEPRSPVIPDRNWDGLTATVQQAMEWGIELSGQLATVHAEDEVVGVISASTIARSRFDQPTLPEPDPRATNAPWEDISALAGAIRALVVDPPPEFLNALLPPYATAVALGQELQDAQEDMGLPVAPIPFEAAPRAALGGFPLEVPPPPREAVPEGASAAEGSADSGRDRADGVATPDPHDEVQEALDRRPNPWALLAIALVIGVVAVVLGVGWR